MEHSLTLLVLTFTIISVMGKIPDYIQVCKRNDPDLSKCVQNSILNLRSRLAKGIPELNVPAIDPLRLVKLPLNLGAGFKAELYNLSLTGGKDFEIHNLVADIAADTYVFNVRIPQIVGTGDYEIDAKIASLPIRGKGPINLVAKSASGRGTLQGRKVARGGKTLYWFPNLNMKIDVPDYNISLGNLFGGDSVIGEVTNKILNEEKTEVLASIVPAIEKALIQHILLSANNIAKTLTWDEMYPES